MKRNISTSELIESISNYLDISLVDIKFVLDGMRDVVIKELVEGNKVTLYNTLTLQTRYYKAHKGINPRTGQQIDLKAQNKVKVKVSKNFNNSINNLTNDLKNDLIDSYE